MLSFRPCSTVVHALCSSYYTEEVLHIPSKTSSHKLQVLCIAHIKGKKKKKSERTFLIDYITVYSFTLV